MDGSVECTDGRGNQNDKIILYTNKIRELIQVFVKHYYNDFLRYP